MAIWHKRNLLAAPATALLLLVAACGGGGRPSADELSTAIQQQARSGKDAMIQHSIDGRSADCMGRVLHDSDLSDEALRAIVAGKAHYDASPADERAMKRIAPDFVSCIPQLKQLKDQLGQLGVTPRP